SVWSFLGSAVAENVSGTLTYLCWPCQGPFLRREAPGFPKRSGTCFNDGMAELAPRVTIREIADRAGVSIATVSRVLNGRGDVSDETRELVSRIIRDNGYVANRSARGLSGGRTDLVGVLVPLVYPAYFSAILAGAAEALAEQDL